MSFNKGTTISVREGGGYFTGRVVDIVVDETGNVWIWGEYDQIDGNTGVPVVDNKVGGRALLCVLSCFAVGSVLQYHHITGLTYARWTTTLSILWNTLCRMLNHFLDSWRASGLGLK